MTIHVLFFCEIDANVWLVSCSESGDMSSIAAGC